MGLYSMATYNTMSNPPILLCVCVYVHMVCVPSLHKTWCLLLPSHYVWLTCSWGAPEVSCPKAKGKTPTLLCYWRVSPPSKNSIHFLSQCDSVNHVQRVFDGEGIRVYHKHIHPLLQDVVGHEDTSHPHVPKPLVTALHNGHIEQSSVADKGEGNMTIGIWSWIAYRLKYSVLCLTDHTKVIQPSSPFG